jgi:long-chain acyl-CoA synthetase
MGLYDISFYDIINRNALSFKQLPAWFDEDDQRTLNFAQYREQVDRLAGGLRQAGLHKGDRIGVLGKNSLEFFLIYGAAAALGAIVLPINWRLSAEEAAFNLNDGQPEVLFADAEFQALIEGIKADLPSVKRYYNLKADVGDFDAFAPLLENSKSFEPEALISDDGLVIIHTAAVAGRPGGAQLSHANIMTCSLHLIFCSVWRIRMCI